MPSPIDQLYETIYGEVPKKPGTAYERLAAAVWKLMNKDDNVTHDSRIRGEISKSLYQIDIEASDDEGRHAGEAKDYTIRRAKVGRSDVQKLGGALLDIPVDTGKFFSATGFTKPARQYASTAETIVGKKIDLFDLRKVVEKDLEGRIKTIVCRFHKIEPAYERSSFQPVFTNEGQLTVKDLVAKGALGQQLKLSIDKIFNADHSVLTTIHELTKTGFGCGVEPKAIGSWWTPGGHIYVGEHFIPVAGITYEVQFDEEISELVIEASGKAVLLIKAHDGTVDRIIQDVDLKNVEFDEDGNAKLKSEKE